MFFFTNHIKKLQKCVPLINFLDIGSNGGLQSWFYLIKDNLHTISFDLDNKNLLFNETGKKIFYKTEQESCSSLFRPNKNMDHYEGESLRQKYTEQEVSVDTLNNKLNDFKGKIDLIKIDTQGSEYEIIEGGLERIQKDKPFLFIETWTQPYYENIKYFDQIISLLRKINYEIYLIDVSGSAQVNLKNKLIRNFGQKKHTGFNVFMGPSLKNLCEVKNEEQNIKNSFIFFVHDLLSFSYKISESYNNDYKKCLVSLIERRSKYKKFYTFYKYFSYIKMQFYKNTNFFPLT